MFQKGSIMQSSSNFVSTKELLWYSAISLNNISELLRKSCLENGEPPFFHSQTNNQPSYYTNISTTLSDGSVPTNTASVSNSSSKRSKTQKNSTPNFSMPMIWCELYFIKNFFEINISQSLRFTTWCLRHPNFTLLHFFLASKRRGCVVRQRQLLMHTNVYK